MPIHFVWKKDCRLIGRCLGCEDLHQNRVDCHIGATVDWWHYRTSMCLSCVAPHCYWNEAKGSGSGVGPSGSGVYHTQRRGWVATGAGGLGYGRLSWTARGSVAEMVVAWWCCRQALARYTLFGVSCRSPEAGWLRWGWSFAGRHRRRGQVDIVAAKVVAIAVEAAVVEAVAVKEYLGMR